MTTCSLCLLSSQDAPGPLLIGRSRHATATLHDDWALPGHAMVVAHAHVENLSDLDEPDRIGFLDLVVRTERALMEVLGAHRVILLKLGLAVPHLHWHLYPADRTTTREELFDAFMLRTRFEPDPAALEAMVTALRSRLGLTAAAEIRQR